MSKWENKVVLVIGGSSGLGLAIAKSFGRRGAIVIIVGRSDERLESAKQELARDGIQVHTRSCDASCAHQLDDTFQSIAAEWNQLDVLVNAVGQSTRAEFQSVDVETYQQFLEINFLNSVRCVSEALPFIEKTSGHIVNIGSLSCKTAWPFMAPYTASKFALAGYTEQLRLEGPENVHVMLVCPGPIRRADDAVRYAEESKDLPENAGKPGAGVNLKGLDADRLADTIVKGCEKRRPEIVTPFKPRLLFIASSLSARLGDWLRKKFSRKSR